MYDANLEAVFATLNKLFLSHKESLHYLTILFLMTRLNFIHVVLIDVLNASIETISPPNSIVCEALLTNYLSREGKKLKLFVILLSYSNWLMNYDSIMRRTTIPTKHKSNGDITGCSVHIIFTLLHWLFIVFIPSFELHSQCLHWSRFWMRWTARKLYILGSSHPRETCKMALERGEKIICTSRESNPGLYGRVLFYH